MRTVDPELWYRKRIQVTRRLKFGQRRAGSLETRLRASWRDALREWWRNCSHVGVKYINIDYDYPGARRWQIILTVLSLSLGWGLVGHNALHLVSRAPVVINLQFADNAIARTPFPAVALCSNNVISKAALLTLTDFLYRHPKNDKYNFSWGYIENNLLNLGALLTLSLPPIKVEFEMFFREIKPDFNITNIMFKLSTNCSVILKRCSWRGRLLDCDRLFATRLTGLGFCCVFNSRYQPEDFGRKPAVLDLVGQDYGLGVVILEEKDDFAYVRRPAYGMEMLLFSGDEFPLLESGNVRMFPLPRNSSLYFNVRTYSQHPDPDISYYSKESRKCALDGSSMPNCLAQCRRETAVALCGCVPFALQAQAPDRRTAARACSLADLACLNKHREKFMYLYPESSEPSLSQEIQDGLWCPECVVSCHRHMYTASVSYSMHRNKRHMNVFRSSLSAGIKAVNGTVLRLFYNADHQLWLKMEAHLRWFEVFVKLSTQWLAVTGVSILCYSEILFHLTLRWRHHFNRRTRIANMEPVTTSA